MALTHFRPQQYEQLLDEKIAELLPKFEALGAPEPEVTSSPKEAFRLRAEFRLWHEGDELSYVMFDPKAPKDPIPVDTFPIASQAIQALMPVLIAAIKGDDLLRHKVFQIEFLSTLAGDMLVTLIYHRRLDDAWAQVAQQLADQLGISIIGRSRKQKQVIGRDYVIEKLEVSTGTFVYQQPEQAFTQPNGAVNKAMINWAVAAATQCADDLLELYCGIGNFTLPLAPCFDNVIATELSKVATAAAQVNRLENGIENVEFVRMSAEDMSGALANERPFRRLSHLKKPFDSYKLKTLLVDPPRAGLDNKTLDIARHFDKVIYISCNPQTLLANLEVLTPSHRIDKLAFFDQFPYTHHLESGVLLSKKP